VFGDSFDFDNNLQFQFFKQKIRIKQPLVLGLLHLCATKNLQFWGFEIFSKNQVGFMKELAENQQFKVGSLTRFFEFWEARLLRLETDAMLCEDRWSREKPSSSLMFENCWSRVSIYSTLPHWFQIHSKQREPPQSQH
jgi:hypothetical protein